jgi:hypothetical protein
MAYRPHPPFGADGIIVQAARANQGRVWSLARNSSFAENHVDMRNPMADDQLGLEPDTAENIDMRKCNATSEMLTCRQFWPQFRVSALFVRLGLFPLFEPTTCHAARTTPLPLS